MGKKNTLNYVSQVYQVKQINMNKIPTHSRGSSVCDYCGKLIIRHNLKKHTIEQHNGQPTRERVVGVMSLDKFVKSMNSTRANNTTNLDDDVTDEAERPLVTFVTCIRFLLSVCLNMYLQFIQF